MSSMTRTRVRRSQRISAGKAKAVAEAAIRTRAERRSFRLAQDRARLASRTRAAVFSPQPDRRYPAGVIAGPEPKNLAEGVDTLPAFAADLRNPQIGHKTVAEAYPFTSESSVRRYRKTHGIVVSR